MKGIMKISGVTYRRQRCSGSKNAIKTMAEQIRAKGGTARIMDNGTHYCLYTGPRKQKRRIKK